MGLQINTNVMALNAQHNLGVTSTRMAKTLEKLSSGLRINRAADDAAGLAVSEKLRSQIRGLSQASRNAQDGISLIQTAEGALNESHSILQRLRELSVQAGTATLQGGDRVALQAEVNQLVSELDRISATTDFNGAKLLNGTLGGVTTNLTGATDLVAGNGIMAVRATTAQSGGTYQLAVANGAGSTKLVTLTNTTNGESQTLNITPPATGTRTLTFSQLGIDIDIASNLTNFAAGATNQFATVSGGGSTTLLIGAGFGATIDPNELLSISIGNMNAATLFGSPIDVTTASAAQTSINRIDTAITLVSNTRATLGALQNRLEHTISSLSVTVENLTASESRIRDTDVAEETSKMVSMQILSQSGVSVLAQANQAPQSVLALLKGG